MADEERKASKARCNQDLNYIRSELEKMSEKADFADVVDRIGNVSQSIMMEVGGEAIPVPEIEPGRFPYPSFGKFTKEYTERYLKEVQTHLDLL
ncbi:hypothetical protein [Chromobacterium haemolyticum]|uniref:hypothetical protein n=1 Tax=Chromobacterium haemolyticum TaxID=394935 RepID=UPI0013175B17|nr:hypothetical protein [Chromobacterium haemolyticum]BBH12870.1 hypothetical protein CH06BL_21180 [Chromobacterium haemolyticum]